jgi:hypothetical protein
MQYTVTYNGTNYRNMSAMSANLTGDGWTDWCGRCHSAYIAPADSGTTASGWTAFNYRHMTTGLSGECMRCHVAHGSTVTMGTNSSTPTWPSGNVTADWQEQSGVGGTEDEVGRLLHVNDRGVCTQCHGSDLVTN